MSTFVKIVALSAVALCCMVTSGLAADTPSTDLFGMNQGYFHPSLKLATEYTDNYKSAAQNTKSEWNATVSPGFWLSLPASKKKSFSIASTNAAPGGSGVSSFQANDFVGLQASVMYNADLVRSFDYREEDLTKHKVQGLLQYAFANGLTLEASDVYNVSAEEYADTTGGELEKFNSNRIGAVAHYKYSPKLKMRVGYSNFTLDYTSGTNVDFKERTDDQFSAYLIYRVLPKTELFVQLDHIRIDYNENILFDSVDEHIFVGLKFDTNARINGHAKLGYGQYDSDIPSNGTFDDFIGDASLRYGFDDRSSIKLSAKQIVNVTDDKIYQNKLHQEIGLEFSHKFTHKFGTTASITFKQDEYRFDSKRSGREDEDLVAGLNLSYTVNDYLKLGAKYTHTDRTSSVASSEYVDNTLIFTGTAAF